MLHTYTYIKTSFESYSKLVSYCDSCISLSHAAHSNRQFLLFRKVWAVYAHALVLSFIFFYQRDLTGMGGLASKKPNKHGIIIRST